MARDNETVVTVVAQALGDEGSEGVFTPCLVVMYGRDLGKRHFLDSQEQIIGRSDAADIQVDQDSVSRQHAKVITRQGKARVLDLESTNGTFLNDARIADAPLSDGDLLRIGQTIFKYLSGSNIESKYHEEIYRLTTIDGLTGAYNKRFFVEALGRELNRAVRYGRELSLAMFDLDHFKKINDRFGHLAGDYVLREISAVVQQNIRRDDIFARYGGEEFALIIPEIGQARALQVCEKLRQAVEQFRFTYNGREIEVTISLGIKTLARGERELDVSNLIAAVDAKLYEAKSAGRNCVVA